MRLTLWILKINSFRRALELSQLEHAFIGIAVKYIISVNTCLIVILSVDSFSEYLYTGVIVRLKLLLSLYFLVCNVLIISHLVVTLVTSQCFFQERSPMLFYLQVTMLTDWEYFTSWHITMSVLKDSSFWRNRDSNPALWST